MIKKIVFTFALVTILSVQFSGQVSAQRLFDLELPSIATNTGLLATDSAQIASPSAEEAARLEEIRQDDVTRVEGEGREEILALFSQRPITELTLFNFIAYSIQYSVLVAGVPSNTVVLILLLPLLASLIAFIRHVIGLPGIGMLIPIALSITLLATGLTTGAILLFSILFASTLARIILKRIRIMQLPKMALSMFIVSVFLIFTLTLSAIVGILTVRTLSIFPVLLLILLSERIVSIQLERSTREVIHITFFTLLFGIIGFFLLSAQVVRYTILLYPELIFFIVPLDIAIGRYFGLRLTEFFRFSSITQHGSK